MTGTANLAASVAARLLNRARETGDDHQTLLTSYCLERFLYRLGASERRDRFVLKGAMLLRLWSDQPYRATRDLDLLRHGDGAFEAIRDDLRAIIDTPVPPDAVSFDGDRINVEAIRAQDEYAGTRATLPVRCGQARLTLQVDMGLGDAIWPAPQACTYPTLLDFPAPHLLAYPREAVVAEKLEAMVVLGDRNSRIKDFFDLHYLASRFEFDRATLAEAVRRTFERRRTPIPAEDPLGLTTTYWQNPSRPAQVRGICAPGRSRRASQTGRGIHASAACVPCAGTGGSAKGHETGCDLASDGTVAMSALRSRATFHRPHPGKEALRYRVKAAREFLERIGAKP